MAHKITAREAACATRHKYLERTGGGKLTLLVAGPTLIEDVQVISDGDLKTFYYYVWVGMNDWRWLILCDDHARLVAGRAYEVEGPHYKSGGECAVCVASVDAVTQDWWAATMTRAEREKYGYKITAASGGAARARLPVVHWR